MIARDLGVSETRINQHIRALKDIYKAESLADLVEAYRVHKIADEEAPEPEKNEWDQNPKPEELALSESVYSKNQVPVGTLMSDQSGQDDPGELVIRDVSSMVDEAPWLRPAEPQVVPRVLDGDNAIWFRLAAIMGIAFGVLAALVLSVTAAITISEVLDGKAAIPVDEQGYS
ncbi:hypothetical protein [uncultured Erythrobacter sp.]|uniref:hypothetical protein n=1 Tax=uncultured Erythrobacter sp. TaxID=263913 RepID=UPI0026220191|nr:hypothetical protein [uncultured Erythrobacter sp.]